MNPLKTAPEFGLIIVGDEILSGKRHDKHMSKVIELLSSRGLSLSHVDYVGDDPQCLTKTLQLAFATPGVVFSCGGIGATPDDHTRQSAAAALGVPAMQPQACEDAAQFLQRTMGIEVSRCPHCHLGQWRTVQLLPPLRAGSTPPTAACRGPP